MVTPMIKYSFLLHHQEQEQLLELLGGSAIVDVEVSGWSADESDKQKLAEILTATTVANKLKSFAAQNDNKEEKIEASEITLNSASEVIELYSENATKIEQLTTQLPKLAKEIEDLTPWGDFSPSKVEALASEGMNLWFYTAPEKIFEGLNNSAEKNQNIFLCNVSGSTAYFIVATGEEKQPSFEGVTSEKRPTQSYKDAEVEYKEVGNQIAQAQSQIAAAAKSLNLVVEYGTEIKEELAEQKIIKTNKSVADDQLILIEGWAPKDRCSEVDALFAENPLVIVFKEAPVLGDNPPVLLKNNKFARLCEVVTRLYSLPKYSELDLTPFFAPFFVFFVGICFGDLGYGLLTFAIGLFVYFKYKNTEAKDIASLVMWCSFATVIMGCATGTFFGVELAKVEAFKGLPFLGQMDMFSFALAVGIIQILYAMFIKGFFEIKHKGFKHGISTLSWAFTLIVSIVAYFGKDLGMESFSMSSPIYKAIIALLLTLYVLFIDPTKKNPLANVGGGLWSLYNALTGILGDTLSYIRLFALGLSGGIIGGVFNSIAIGMMGDIPVVKYLIMILIMLFGHSINIFMSAISSFVHPLRLTFVEFYKCAGYEGGGKEYTPFKKSVK